MVPTWNYVVVQAWGTPRVIDDVPWLLVQVEELTEEQEAARAEPWAVGDAPSSFVDGQLKGIVGVQIPIARVEGKWKASQNQPLANRAGIAHGLRELDPSSPMAELVANTARD